MECGGTAPLCVRCRLWQKSEEPIRARKLGNASGAKDLWFGRRPNETDERGLA